jgi:hypothetical protein
MDDSLIYYFGYGANRSKQRVSDILGEEPKGGFGAVIENFSLCVQTVDQIPDPPRELIRTIWGGQFRGYTICPAVSGLVSGVLWRFTVKQLERMKEWECISTWKESVTISVVAFDGIKELAITEKVSDDQQVFEVVDGLNYENNLNLQGMKQVVDDEYRIRAMQRARIELEKILRP